MYNTLKSFHVKVPTTLDNTVQLDLSSDNTKVSVKLYACDLIWPCLVPVLLI